MMNNETLSNRTFVLVSGSEAGEFLDGLITCDVSDLKTNEARFGGLLSPQGKILFDFFVLVDDAGYLFDIHSELGDEFIKRLMFYRLRRQISIEPANTVDGVAAVWGDIDTTLKPKLVADPRLCEMGYRHYFYGDKPQDTNTGEYTRHRLQIGMPEGGADFQYGSAFPHETLMDQFGGIDFQKGCYVGQEVVSRMQHRGTARKRLIKVSSNTSLPTEGTGITADCKPVGTMASSTRNIGLANIRLDRVSDAIRQGSEITSDGVPLRLELPDWVTFTWPSED